MHGLREEPGNFAGPVDGQLVFLGQFIHTQNRDDVLQFLIALQDALNLLGHIIMLLTNHQRVQLT